MQTFDAQGRARGVISPEAIQVGDLLRAYIYGKPSYSDQWVTKINRVTIQTDGASGVARHAISDLLTYSPGYYRVIVRKGHEFNIAAAHVLEQERR